MKGVLSLDTPLGVDIEQGVDECCGGMFNTLNTYVNRSKNLTMPMTHRLRGPCISSR